MVTRRVDIDAQLKDSGSIAKAAKDAERLGQNIAKAAEQFKRLQAEAQASQKALGAPLNQVARRLGAGQQSSVLTNAQVKGTIANLNAQTDQVFSQLTNSVVRNLKNFVRAVNDRAIIDLKNAQQTVLATSRAGLQQQLAAQNVRVAQASTNPNLNNNLPGVRQSANNSLKEEQRLRDRIAVALQNTIFGEQRLERIQRQRLDLANRLRVARLEDNRDDQTKLVIKGKELQIERLIIQGGEQELAQAKRLIASKERLVTLEEARRRSALSTLSAEERAAKSRTQQTVANLGKINDRQFLDSQSQLQRESISNRLFGDGGAFLLKIQAQLAANFLILNQVFRLFQFGKQFIVDLDKAFFDLQAITATTKTEMASLSVQLVDISTKTKFTAVQVAEAAVLLGQAGFSVNDITKSLESITLLATAIGADLKQSVDLVTSALNVFNLQSIEAGNVANIFTSAINNSKLTLDKLAAGFQFSGNAAAQTGTTFEELTAALGAMSNAGIRSGSILGTNLRRLLLLLNSPTTELTTKLRQFGLTQEDINVRSQGLTGVFENLRKAGFSTAAAFESMDIRAGAAFAALANNTGTIEELRQVFLLSNSAAKANEIQMESLANKIDRTASIIGTFINEAAQPFLEFFKVVVDGIGDFINVLNKAGATVSVLGTVLFSVISGALIGRFAKMAANLAGFAQAAKVATPAVAGLATAVGTVATATSAFAVALTRLVPIIGVLSAVAFFAFMRRQEQAADAVDKLQAKVNTSTQTYDEQQQTIKSLNLEIQKLIDRSRRLRTDQQALNTTALELEQKFGGLGAQFDSNSGKVEEFIDKLNALRQKMLELAKTDLSGVVANLDLLAVTQFQSAAGLLGNPSNRLRNAAVKGQGVQPGGQGRAPFSKFQIPTQAQAAFGRSLNVLDNQGTIKALQGGNLTASEGKDLTSSFIPAIASINTLLRDIATGAVDFSRLTADQVEFIRSLAEETRDRLKLARDAIADATSKRITQESNERQLKITSLDSTGFFQQAKVGIDSLGLELRRRIEASNEPGQTAEQKEAIRTGLEDLLQRVLDLQTDSIAIALENGLNEEEFFATESSQLIDQLKGSIIQQRDLIDKARLEILTSRDKAQTEFLKSRLQEIKKKANSSTPLKDLEKFQALAINLQRQLTAIEIRQEVDRQRKEGELRLGPDGRETFTTDGKLNLTNIRRKGDSEVQTIIDDFNDAGLRIDKAIKDVPDRLENFSKALQTITKDLELARAQNQRDVRRANLALSVQDLPQFRNNISDVQTKKLQDQIPGLQTEALKRDSNSLQDALNKQAVVRRSLENQQLRVLLERSSRQQVVDEFESGGRKDISQDKAKELRSDIERLTKDLTSINTKLVDSENLSKKTLEELNQTLEELEYRLGTTSLAADDFATTFKDAFDQFAEDTGALKTPLVRVGDELKGVFSTVNTSFQDAAKNILTGTESIGEAFRNMALKIIEAMLDIAVKQAALGLVGLLSSAFAPSGPGPGAGPPVRIAGGYIRAAGGAPSTRDNRLILAQDGEYVLRKSAVDAVGRENLDMINALGNRSISKSTPAGLPAGFGQGGGLVNVWIVSPDQQTPLGPKDVIAVIGRDIQTSGSTKQLIKQVQLGVI